MELYEQKHLAESKSRNRELSRGKNLKLVAVNSNATKISSELQMRCISMVHK